MTNCGCGCGERTGGGLFRPGHDQKLRTALEHRVGGLVNLSRLVESAEQYSAGESSIEDFADTARRLFARGRG